MRKRFAFLLLTAVLAAAPAFGANQKDKKDADESRFKSSTFSGLSFRGIGPALTSGRIGDIAVHPTDRSTWFVAVSSGGVWKTTNAGTTWSPIFDGQGSYSIGCVTIDPKNPLTVWVGTGENNSQRSVSYGDGLYKSIDGGASWKKVGLESSEHIGKIIVDPRDSGVVYVAAQGPLWSKGGDRGLYKTTDGGAKWDRVLEIDEYTGVTDVVFDPRNPDILYAAAYQRHRRVWTLIDGGPGSALYKSTDAGASWNKLENGLPKEEMGRIGLAVSPVDPDVVYAIVEAAGEASGFYRSTDAGGNWKKMSDYVSDSPQYYQEIVADPKEIGRVYSLDTWMKVTEDGGATFKKVGEKAKHVDNHALWIDPDDTQHLLAGCDGGVYESFDRGATWHFKDNLPVTQFYKITVDNDTPFYSVYGGTQDNFTLGGPSRTNNYQGITNSDWYVTVGGDGFQSRVDPADPDIIYSQFQNGGLVRFDRRTGELIDIRPQPEPDAKPLRWNWDSPLIISPHLNTRLYYGANILFRSDDRGDTWRPVSPDLTRQLDRNKLDIMDRVWSVDAVAKNRSTSYYGNLVALSESPLQEGLIYTGSDDGLVQVTEDGGASWRAVDGVKGIPELSYVSRVEASLHDSNVVYAAWDNHKTGDFKPYLMKSADRGRTWRSIAGDLPERGSVYALAEDHQKPGLLFAGTEFGVFYSPSEGGRWVQLSGGIPPIAVRDLAIQKREDDLVVGTFGRGFYILDDFTPLRHLTEDALEKEAILFDVKTARVFMPAVPLGLPDKSFQGDSFYTAPNPPFGAVFTYYLRDEYKTLKAQREEKEKKLREEGKDVFYPSWDELRAEDREEAPSIIVTIEDDEGNVVRRLSGPVKEGFHRVAWDLRYPPPNPTSLEPPETDNPFADQPIGPLSVPGRYKVSIAKRVGGEITPLGEPRSFKTEPLRETKLRGGDLERLAAFQKKTSRLQRAVQGAVRLVSETDDRLEHLKKALHDAPEADPSLAEKARELEGRLEDLKVELTGDDTIDSRQEPTMPSIAQRVGQIVGGHWSTTQNPTTTHTRAYEIASAQFAGVLEKLRTLVEVDLRRLESDADAAGAPWTPGRIPDWRPE